MVLHEILNENEKSYKYIIKSNTGESCNSSISDFVLRKFQSHIQSCYIRLHFHQQYIKVSLSPCPHNQHLLFVFLVMDVLLGKGGIEK